MKYLLSLILFALLLQPIQAATTIEDSLQGTAIQDIFESSDIIGIGRIAKMVRAESPIKAIVNLSDPLQGQGGGNNENRLGLRLYNIMNESSQAEAASAVDIDPSLAVSTDIVGSDTDIDSGAAQGGRMYPPRLEVDFQKFPVPTYAVMPGDVQQKRMAKLNSQIQKRFGESVQVDYLENVHYLRGIIDSKRQKDVLELFIKMEPGIREVRNEVVIRKPGLSNP